MPRRHVVAFVLVLAALVAGGCALFGKPEYCTKRHQGSFATFLEEDWRAYCTRFQTYADNPGKYSLVELTRFFGNHPERIDQLQQSMIRFENPEACFVEPKEKLEYRRLSACLEYDEDEEQMIIDAWTARAEPWLEDIALDVRSVRPRVGEASREADRLLREAEEAFEYNSSMNPAAFEEFSKEVRTIDKKLSEAKKLDQTYRELLALAQGSQALVTVMNRNYGPRVAEISQEVSVLSEKLDEIQRKKRFVEFAVHAAGKSCPKGVEAEEEAKLAKKLLHEQIQTVGGMDPRISSPITLEERGPVHYERFAGFVCGIRTQENQFEGHPKLCGLYRFKFERTRGHDDPDWEAWKLESFEESGTPGGVDCSLMK